MVREERDENLEQVQDSRFVWQTAANNAPDRYYYCQWWKQTLDMGEPKYCVVKAHKDKQYYVSDCDDDSGAGDIGPFNSLEDAASVCVMKNYGN